MSTWSMRPAKLRPAAVTRQPQPRFTDRDEALNQLTAAFAVCLEAGLTDIPGLVKQIIEGAEPEPAVKPH
jgi:hypothetical protein